MAYCVHCGVKLGEGEKRCPLCQTPVYDPAEPHPAPAPKPYPVRTPEQELKRSKRFLLTLSALTAKVCGALFRIPLTSLLGGRGMGYFSTAYGLFLPLYLR